MSGQDETLRLVAEVVNKWSGPLRDMRNDLQRMSGIVKDTHARGAKHAREHAAAHEHLRKALEQVKEVAAEGVKPTLEALGVTSLTVAGAIAAVTAAVRGFAGSARELRFASRELGLSINQLRELDALSARIGSTPEAMRGGVATFARNMEQLRRHRGALQQFFASQHDVGVRGFGEQLSHVRDNAQALAQTLQFLDRIRDPQQRQNFLAALGLDPHLARLSAGELAATLADIRRNIGSLSDDAVRKGLAAQEAFDRLEESIGRLKEEIGVEFAPTLKEATDAIRQLLVEAGRDGTIKELAGDFREIAHTIGAVLGAARDAIKWLDRHAPGGLLGQRDNLRYGRAHHESYIGPNEPRAPGAPADRMLLEPFNPGLRILRWWRDRNGPSSSPSSSLIGAGAGAGAGALRDVEESVKKGSEQGIKSGLQQWYDGLGWTPISDQPGANPGLQRYGGGRFAMFGPPRGPGNAVRSALAPPGDDQASARTNAPQAPIAQVRTSLGKLFNPITGTALGGGVGGSSASMGPHRHQGDDIMAPWGSPLYAIKDGVIDHIGVDNFRQPAITIRHADGTYSRYLHVGRVGVHVGQAVRGGEVIGGSGAANGVSHLHFEMWANRPNGAGIGLLNPRRIFGWGSHNLPHAGALLYNAIDNGVAGGGAGVIRGAAAVHVDLNGFPRGTRAITNAGGIFNSIELTRGPAAPMANSE